MNLMIEKKTFVPQYKQDAIYKKYVRDLTIVDKRALPSTWDDYIKSDQGKKIMKIENNQVKTRR